MRILGCVAVALPCILAACGQTISASAPRTTTAGRSAAIRTEVNNGAGYEFLVSRTEAGFSLTLPASLDGVRKGLVAAYRELEIPVADPHRSTTAIESRALTLRARFAGEPLTLFLECGRILGGRIASTYRVQLSVVSLLEPVGVDETRLVSRVSATASDPASSAGGVSCASTGELERRIAAVTALRLGQP